MLFADKNQGERMNVSLYLRGIGKVFYENFNTIRYHEVVKNICVVGLTAKEFICIISC